MDRSPPPVPPCPPGQGFLYHTDSNSCYLFFRYPQLNWAQASAHCQSLNSGHLASIHSDGEHTFVYQNFAWQQTIWIGYTDLETEGSFAWSDQSPAGDFAHWANGEPNNFRGKQHCVFMSKGGNWQDSQCRKKNSFICRTDGDI